MNAEIFEKWKIKKQAILDCYNSGHLDLNEWEINFIDSIDILLSNNSELSFKQSSCLSKIFDRIE